MPQIYELLQEDHRKVSSLLQKLERADKNERVDLLDDIQQELELHMKFEEEIFYPEVRAATGLDDEVEEGVDEHEEARTLLAELMNGASESEQTWKETVKSLTQAIEHHVEEEEGKMFPAARKSVGDGIAEDLGEQYEQFKLGDVEALED